MHPVLIEIGPISIRFYGLMYVIAILLALFMLRGEIRRKQLPLTEDRLADFLLFVVLGGIVGARIYYVVFNWDYYGANPLQIPAIWRGGLAIHGGLIGGFLAGFWFCRHYQIPLWRMADTVAPNIILGQTLGRFGNFMNGDAHGLPLDSPQLPWIVRAYWPKWLGVVFPPGSIAGDQFPGQLTHPAMLYELVLDGLAFAFLWKIRTRPAKDGFLFGLYLILYSIIRFFVSFFRADSLMLGSLRAAQVVSVLLVLIVGAIMFHKRLWVADTSPPASQPVTAKQTRKRRKRSRR
ncbi:MAG: prolipoprotein diacylglyceryl transferase [Nitrospinota bacterium]|nr:MAG: prolipoprotein diacylglyceryl transferase [Nitrospinota bacterium]